MQSDLHRPERARGRVRGKVAASFWSVLPALAIVVMAVWAALLVLPRTVTGVDGSGNPKYGSRAGKAGQPAIREIRFYSVQGRELRADFKHERPPNLHLLLDVDSQTAQELTSQQAGLSRIKVHALPSRLLLGLPQRFTVGRYHSLFAEQGSFPAVLKVTAETEDGVIMAIEHKGLPIAAVQFHPESIMTSPGEIGMPILETALALLCEKAEA